MDFPSYSRDFGGYVKNIIISNVVPYDCRGLTGESDFGPRYTRSVIDQDLNAVETNRNADNRIRVVLRSRRN